MKTLTKMQATAVSAPVEKHCAVTAVAGAGKTTVLEQRIKKLYKDGHEKQLVITFTKKAATNLKARLGNIPDTLFVGTIHSFCLQMLLKYAPKTIGSKFVTDALAFKVRMYASQYCASMRLKLETDKCHEHIIKLFKDGHLPETWESLPGRKANHRMAFAVHSKLKAEGLMFFEELIIGLLRVLREDARALKELQEEFPVICVDEFQDTDKVQCALLKQLLGATGHLYVVGDSAQSIYGWRGCDPTIFENFDDHFGDATKVVLDTNFRSNDGVLSRANTVLEQMGAESRMSGVLGPKEDAVTFRKFENEQHEADAIVEEISKSGEVPTKFAILYRINQQSGLLQSGLAKAGIPFTVSGEALSFFDFPEIRALVGYLRLAYDPTDVDALKTVWNKPNRYLRTEWIESAITAQSDFDAVNIVQDIGRHRKMGPKQRSSVAKLVKVLRSLKAADVRPITHLENLLTQLDYDKYLADIAENSSRDVSDLRTGVRQFLSIVKQFANVKGLLLHIEQVKRLQKENKDLNRGVTLSTIHSAKGLEFPSVYLIGTNDDILPHKEAFTVDEEHRLLYVAMTRAEERLSVSCYGKASRFLRPFKSQIVDIKLPEDT